MSEKVKKTKKELEAILLEEIQKILGNNVTSEALDFPSSMKFSDLIVNLQLWERLGAAHVALGALRGYAGQPRGFELVHYGMARVYIGKKMPWAVDALRVVAANWPESVVELFVAGKTKTFSVPKLLASGRPEIQGGFCVFKTGNDLQRFGADQTKWVELAADSTSFVCFEHDGEEKLEILSDAPFVDEIVRSVKARRPS